MEAIPRLLDIITPVIATSNNLLAHEAMMHQISDEMAAVLDRYTGQRYPDPKLQIAAVTVSAMSCMAACFEMMRAMGARFHLNAEVVKVANAMKTGEKPN
jgi:phage gp36-like protein